MRDRVQVLKEEGWTTHAIAKQLGLHQKTVWRWCNPEKDAIARKRENARERKAPEVRSCAMCGIDFLTTHWRKRFHDAECRRLGQRKRSHKFSERVSAPVVVLLEPRIQAERSARSIFPLWKVTYGGAGPINWIYVTAPKRGRYGVLAVRAVARVQLRGRRIVRIEKVEDHPLVRGDERIDSNGFIRAA